MARAGIDIGTNSMRLLIVDDAGQDLLRIARITGLGAGMDANRRFDPDAMRQTLDVFDQFGRLCEVHGADRRRAVATSATRDAEDRETFLDLAAEMLGVRPEVISGVEEADLAYRGATADRSGDHVVVDIGGGSTEFSYRAETVQAVSIDIGSVRLTDRLLPTRPVDYQDVETAITHVEGLFAEVDVPVGLDVIGVAGTWTSLAAIVAGKEGSVHDAELDRLTVERLVVRLASLSVEETARLPGLDPARAPVILAGAVIAREAIRRLDVTRVTVSERDLLDGIVAGL
jgi:exopolyphosphatase/guanosine-5'-triphosphate,3'-diphosphate pyrophosphatase